MMEKQQVERLRNTNNALYTRVVEYEEELSQTYNRIAELLEKNAKLREALRPFAHWYKIGGDTRPLVVFAQRAAELLED